MYGRVVAATMLLVTSCVSAGDDPERGGRDSTPLELPPGWLSRSDVAAAVGYVRFDDLGRLGSEAADGTAAQLSARLGLIGGSYLSLGGEYHWLQRETGGSIDFGYVRAGVGYQYRLTPFTDVGVELGAQGQIGKDFFGTDKVTEDAEYGRIWLRSVPTGHVHVQASATLGSDYLSGDLRCEWPVPDWQLQLGAALAAGRAEDADFWSIGPSVRWMFGRAE